MSLDNRSSHANALSRQHSLDAWNLLPSPVACLDRDGGILWSNNSYLMSGLPSDSLAVAAENGGLEPGWAEIDAAIRAEGRAAGVLRCDGRIWIIQMNLLPGEEGLHTAVFSEATSLMETEAEHQRHLRQEALARMASGINHDFNNVLFILSGNLELAEMTSSPETRETLAKAADSLDRARDFCRRLTTLARGGDPRQELTEPARWLASMVDKLSTPLHPITLEMESSLPNVCIDTDQFGEVLRGIVENAREAMPGSGSIQFVARREFVHVCNRLLLAPGPYLVLEIRDYGRGMPPCVLERAGEPFYTTRPLGRGLDLAEARAIAQRHGGRLVLRSRLGAGTTVLLHIPAAG
jgi:signal transduction histidine kinase